MTEAPDLSLLVTALVMVIIMFASAIAFLAAAVRIVPESRRMALFRLGRYIGEVGPGIVILLPLMDRGVLIDIGDQVAEAEALREMFGVVGMTQTPVHDDGTVEIEGRPWNATSPRPIPPGTQVRATKVILQVEEIQPRM